jgi:hypothetical protein
MTMKRLSVPGSLAILLAGVAGAGVSSHPPDRRTTPEALKAEVEALRPADHVWRAIPWKTCPLEALKAARAQNKPVIAWVFLGVPTDERC